MDQTGKHRNSYWVNYYNSKNKAMKPSSFANFIAENFSSLELDLTDFCCGDARDSFLLGNYFKSVAGVDFATQNKNCKNVSFSMSNICDWIESSNNSALNSYIRFGLHSIEEDTENKILENSRLLMAEFRSDKDDSYVNDHFRRKINGNDFIKKLFDYDFEIKYYTESHGLSVHNGQDPTLVRIVAKKRL